MQGCAGGADTPPCSRSGMALLQYRKSLRGVAMRCVCGQQLTGAVLEAPGVASAFCPSGHRIYLFKHLGRWETAEERQRRMRVTMVCGDCGRKFSVADMDRSECSEREFCDPCLELHVRQCSLSYFRRKKGASGYTPRDNSKTPWRLRAKLAPANYHRMQRDNPK